VPADESFMERAQLYCDLDALELFDTAVNDDEPAWTEVAVRMLDDLIARNLASGALTP
jgi:hypothetical protein